LHVLACANLEANLSAIPVVKDSLTPAVNSDYDLFFKNSACQVFQKSECLLNKQSFKLLDTLEKSAFALSLIGRLYLYLSSLMTLQKRAQQ